MVDVLGEVLEQLALRGTVFCETAARAPWGIRFNRRAEAFFHIVTAGTCWLFAGGRRLRLVAGDVVLLPRGTGHALVDAPTSKRVGLDEWLASRSKRPLGGDGAETRVLCGVYASTVVGVEHPVLRLLPEVLHVPASLAQGHADLGATLAALAREAASGARGSSLVVARLLEVLFVHLVRVWADGEGAGNAGWIGALADPTLTRALALLHGAVAREWTVEELARAAGTSRATLARRFVAEVGEPPHAYLGRLRMQEATRRLVTSDEPLAAIASAVGYASEFAFNRAFRRSVGVPPGAYRREHRLAS